MEKYNKDYIFLKSSFKVHMMFSKVEMIKLENNELDIILKIQIVQHGTEKIKYHS